MDADRLSIHIYHGAMIKTKTGTLAPAVTDKFTERQPLAL